MTNFLGKDNNNGQVLGVTNNALPTTTVVTSLGTSDTSYTPIAPTGNVLVIGGGGGGGQNGGGGGGAGGAIYYPNYPFPGSPVSMTIGAGGGNQASGSNTIFNPGSPLELTALGGGNGGTQGGGTSGGSGGGGGHQGNPNSSPGGGATQIPSMPAPLQPFGYGNNGGSWQGPSQGGAGGGGSGAAGSHQNATASIGKQFGGPLFEPGFAPLVPAPESGYFAGGGAGYTGGEALGGGGGPGNPGAPGGNGDIKSGGGAGGGAAPGGQNGGTGGSGTVAIAQTQQARATGIWNLQTVYTYRLTNTWPS